MGPILEGKDVIGLAQTGTGKTAAFALPIINRLAGRMELGALVLAPTRELAAQISEVFEKLGSSSGVRVATIVGGIPMEQDLKALRSWPNVLVATPGRLIDHLSGGTVSVNEIEVLTIDEADRMHDMGFIPQIRQIINRLPEKRQTLMFTATLSGDVEHVARQSMRDAVRIQVGTCVPVKNATQQLFELTEDDKTPKLLELLRQTLGRALVFLRTKRGVDRLSRTLSRNHVHAGRLHGDMEQPARDKAMAAFRDGSCRILIATDIAARGIDVADIEHVINFDFPHAADDYVHRVGRTARQEATGLATSFITRGDRRFVMQVKRLLGDKMPLVQSLLHAGRDHSDPGRESHRGGSHAHAGTSSHAPAGEHGGKKRRRRRGGRGRNRQAQVAQQAS